MPSPSMEAIYLMAPSQQNVKKLVEDVNSKHYLAVHVFFTEACPDDLFRWVWDGFQVLVVR